MKITTKAQVVLEQFICWINGNVRGRKA